MAVPLYQNIIYASAFAEITCHRCCGHSAMGVHKAGRQTGGSQSRRVTGNVGSTVEGMGEGGVAMVGQKGERGINVV